MVGKPRSAGIVILLSIVTLGIYWFIWTRSAFGEVADAARTKLPVHFWWVTLVAWVFSIGIAAYRIPRALRDALQEALNRDPSAPPPSPFDGIMDSIREQYSPLGLATIALGLVMYGAQLGYLRPANELVRRMVAPFDPNAPGTGMVVLFSVLIMAGMVIPFIGGLAGLAGYIIAIVWIVQVQGAINRFWQRGAMMQQAPPMYGQPAPAPFVMPPR